jgi:glycosyltransferase involved in cell wall biosynthesis
MRIGIDAREMVGRQTGVGRHLSGLLAEWRASDVARAHQFVLYAHEAIPDAAAPFATRIVPGASGTWWQQVQLPRAIRDDGLDVFFSPQYTAPLLVATRTVMVLYDVSFAAHPEWFRFREGLRLRWLSRAAAAHASAVITISDFSRREIVEHLNVPASRIHVIPPGVPVRNTQQQSRRELKMLFVGSIFNRRHVPDLIVAVAPILRAHPSASLDIVGDNRSYPHEDVVAAIEGEQLARQITWHRYASDEQLADLYGRARAFVFLSEYEGLGLTPLEALTAGVPPVLFDTAVSRESCGDAALYVPRERPRDITGAIEQVLFDEGLRSRLLAAAPGVLARFSWARAARETLAVLESCSVRLQADVRLKPDAT